MRFFGIFSHGDLLPSAGCLKSRLVWAGLVRPGWLLRLGSLGCVGQQSVQLHYRMRFYHTNMIDLPQSTNGQGKDQTGKHDY